MRATLLSSDNSSQPQPAQPAGGGGCCARLKAAGIGSSLPVVVVDTSGAAITTDSGKILSSICTCGAPGAPARAPQERQRTPLLPPSAFADRRRRRRHSPSQSGGADVEGTAEVAVRGSTSARDYANKSFNARFLAPPGEDGKRKKQEVPFLGAPHRLPFCR